MYLCRVKSRAEPKLRGTIAVPPIIALFVCGRGLRERAAARWHHQQQIPHDSLKREHTWHVQMQQVGSDPTLVGIERQARPAISPNGGRAAAHRFESRQSATVDGV